MEMNIQQQMQQNGNNKSQPPFELNPTIQCNDLKAFERRLMETIIQQRPRERVWRIVLFISLGVTLTSSYFWLHDSVNTDSSLVESLATHYVFSVNCFILIMLFFIGAHRRVIQSNIIVNRIRQVLYDFALTCDDNGKLIIKQNYSRNSISSSSHSQPTAQFSPNLMPRKSYPY